MIEYLQFGAVLIALLLALINRDDSLFTAGIMMIMYLMIEIDPGEFLFGVFLLCMAQTLFAVFFLQLSGVHHGIVQGILVCFHLILNLTLCFDVIFWTNHVYDNFLLLSSVITLLQCVALVLTGGACAIYRYIDNNKYIDTAIRTNQVHH